MSVAKMTTAPVRHADRFFIGGEWVEPSSDATIDVIDSGTEELYYQVAAAGPDDVARAIAAARQAFDEGPWPRMTHAERADQLRALGTALVERGIDGVQIAAAALDDTNRGGRVQEGKMVPPQVQARARADFE